MLKNIILLIVLSLVVHHAKSITPADINQLIQEQNALWTAGTTSVSILPPEDQKKMLGAPELEVLEFVFEYDQASKNNFPDQLDWRNVKGVDYMSPITNQGVCGSCVAFAAIGALEGQINIANKWTGLNFDFSEQQLFACGGGDCNYGWYPFMALYNMKSYGVVDEPCLKYTSGSTGLDVECTSQCSDAGARKFILSDYTSNQSQQVLDVSDVIGALQNGPLLGRMNVYEDFFSYTSGIYSHVTGNLAGGHAIVLVGYDAKKKYWIVRNSWGTHWGEAGYFKIKFDDISGVGLGTFSLTVAPSIGIVKIAQPGFKELISGTYVVELLTTVKDTKEMRLELKKDGVISNFIADKAKDNERFIVRLDTTKLAEGAYEAKAISTTGKSQIESQIKEVLILNSTPAIKMTFLKPADQAVVSGRLYSEIETQSTPIDLTQLHMHIKYPDGHIQTLKNFYPTPVTKMNWRTTYSPNGKYEIWAEGFIGKHAVTSKKLKITVAN